MRDDPKVRSETICATQKQWKAWKEELSLVAFPFMTGLYSKDLVFKIRNKNCDMMVHRCLVLLNWVCGHDG